MKNFYFSGGSAPRQRLRASIDAVVPRKQSIKRSSRKRSDLTVLNLSFGSKNDIFFKDWNKLPGRFLSKTKGIKRYSGKQEGSSAVNVD
jgi:hypothetical protein